MSPPIKNFSQCPPPARRKTPAWVGPVAALVFAAGRVAANPEGMVVAGGSASAVANGNTLNITAGNNAVINWSSFNIGAGETTTFLQPGAMSVVWNRIADANPSQIWGNLNANGIVVLMNQSGFYFGPNSSINVGGFIATTAPINPPLPSGAPVWAHPTAPPLASIINYGQVKVNNGGSLFLVAEKIENHGILSAPDGTLGLYAGKEVLISERPDGRGLSAHVTLEEGSIDNRGQISADGGSIALRARVVNQDGVIQANSVRTRNGVIELIASDAVNLGANSIIQANGDSVGVSDAGQVTIKSAGTFSDAAGSRLEVRGGANGGNGGDVEVSALTLGDIHSRIDGAAQAGFTGGKMLVDPFDLTLTSASLAAYFGFSQILMQATHDITLSAFATLDLAGSTGVTAPGSLFTLQAGNNIAFEEGARIVAGDGWSVNLMAGVDFSGPTPVVQSGSGGIYLGNGSGAETSDGDLTAHAGHEVLLDYSHLRSTGGGNLFVTADDGDVNAGFNLDTYDFSPDGYVISAQGLGGIGTAGGGNVTVHAGNDILAYNAAIGAFGAAAGDVDLSAGRDVQGRFLVRNGTGMVQAGRDAGSGSGGLSLGLVAGGWNVNAANDIFLNEVYNPSGALNSYQASTGARVPFQFDYAPDAFASLTAGHGVSLMGDNLAITPDNRSRPPIYAPILNIAAGAGGVNLGNDVVLYPSAQGYLSIVTTDHGSLRSNPGQYFQLIMSDSGSADYATFISGHAAVPLHLGQVGPAMRLDIAGDLQNLFIASPGRAEIRVHGDVPSFGFQGQNLAGSDVTILQIDGNYFSRSQLDSTTVTLADNVGDNVPAALARIFNDENQAINPGLGGRLTYDPVTRKLSFRGRMTAQDLAFLLNPIRYQWDALNGYQLDAGGNRVIISDTLSHDTAALQSLFDLALLNIPTSPLADAGLQIGGPGLFRVGAANMDLGISSGIRSVGTFLNPGLASVSAQGAHLDLQLTGDLDMTSSQIASFNGGGIAIHAGGHVNVGSQNSLTSDSTPKGIYTGHGGGVLVEAVGDINVAGSRIATYDGGDVTVISTGKFISHKDGQPIDVSLVNGSHNVLYVSDSGGDLIHDPVTGAILEDASGNPARGYLVDRIGGNVNAGDGAKGFFYVTTSSLNPLTGQVEQHNDKFFGSGIVALTLPNSQTRVGDINVHAGGDIRAGSGGIIQLAFNNYDQTGAKVTMLSDAGNILAGQSGVLSQSLEVGAPLGSIEGIFVAAGNADIHAQNNVNVTALAGGTANVSGGGTVSGSIVGGTGASVSGGEGVSASVISTGGSASANGSESSGSAFAGVAAPAAQKTTEDASTTVANKSLAEEGEAEDLKKKRGNKPAIARRVSRVTVILPNRK